MLYVININNERRHIFHAGKKRLFHYTQLMAGRGGAGGYIMDIYKRETNTDKFGLYILERETVQCKNSNQIIHSLITWTQL